jgi:hypothetical protein
MKLTVERCGEMWRGVGECGGPWRFPRDSITQTNLPHDQGSKGAEAITSFRSSCVLKEELVVQPGQRQPRKCGLRDYQILVCKPDPFSGLRYSVTQTVFRGAMTKLGCPGDKGASRDRSMSGQVRFFDASGDACELQIACTFSSSLASGPARRVLSTPDSDSV